MLITDKITLYPGQNSIISEVFRSSIIILRVEMKRSKMMYHDMKHYKVFKREVKFLLGFHLPIVLTWVKKNIGYILI